MKSVYTRRTGMAATLLVLAWASASRAQQPQATTSPRTTPSTAAAASPLTLDSAVVAALATHPSILAAEAQVDRAEAGEMDARAAWLPSLSLDASAMKYQLPMVVAPLHGFNPQRPPFFDDKLASGGVSLGWTVFDAARGARSGRARALAGAAGAAEEGTRLQLLGQVARAYLRAASRRELVAAHDRRVAALESEQDRAAKVFAQGRAARVTLLRAEAALSQALAERESARMDAEVSERELARLMGVAPERVADAPLAQLRLRGDTLSAAATPPGAVAAPGAVRGPLPPALPARAQAMERALASNPDLAALRRQEEAARAGTSESRALWLPRLQLVGRLAQYASSDYTPSHEWQGGVQLSYPLFTGGSRLAANERADAELRGARAALAQAQLQVQSALDQALASVRSAYARVAALQSAVAQSEEVARIEKLALDTGSGVQTDYLTAEAQLLGARASLTEARAAEASARIELARVTGELSRAWLSENLRAAESER